MKESDNMLKCILTPSDKDNFDEYELEQLQHRILSQNIKQGMKTTQSSFKLNLKGRESDGVEKANFKEFKNFLRPSTSAAVLHPTKKLLKGNEDLKFEGPRFLNVHDNVQIKDIKTYKDIQNSKHMGPLEINYMCKLPDYYEKNSGNCPTTAPKTSSKRKRVKIDENSIPITSLNNRMQISKTSHGKRSNSAGILEQITLSPKSQAINQFSRIRPSTQGNQFPEDFCIENTLNQYPYQFNAKYGIGDFDFFERKNTEKKSESVIDPEIHTTEMILHMKGPMYSVAERNKESSNSTMQQFARRMYFTKANPKQFFRKPIHVYPSLTLANPNKPS